MKNNLKIRCYRCDHISTSREHVPPLCLFPEIKDTNGINFRINLITVPSCDLHNLSKSDDDEFLMLSLSGLIKNNPVGTFHQLTKANRAIKRKNKDFLGKRILRNRKYKKYNTMDGKELLISIGNPDINRLSKCFEHIAYGLFYHEFKKRFKGEIRSILGFVEYIDDNKQTFKKFIRKRFEYEKKLNRGQVGDNPEVFHYCFHNTDEYGITGLRIVFYGSAEIYFAFLPNDIAQPHDMIKNLIDTGKPIIIELENEKFELNKN